MLAGILQWSITSTDLYSDQSNICHRYNINDYNNVNNNSNKNCNPISPYAFSIIQCELKLLFDEMEVYDAK